MSAKHVLYFGQTPSEGTGSPITILRHLRRCRQNGWDVSVVSEWGESSIVTREEEWAEVAIPLRRTWWPPYKPENRLLRAIRTTLWAGECARKMRGAKPDAIVTYLSIHSVLMSEIAGKYSKNCRVPMTTIIHDNPSDFGAVPEATRNRVQKRSRQILRHSQQSWFVSEELAEVHGFEATSASVLLPIPSGSPRNATWRDTFLPRPIVVYAGHLCEAQFSLFKRLGDMIYEAGGQLEILAKESSELKRLCASARIVLHPLFPTNLEAVEFVGRRAAGFLAAYCDRVEEMPWIKTSFPSKVVEFGTLGLPILFVSPEESAIHRWNKRRNVPYNLTVADIVQVRSFVDSLKSRDKWNFLASSTYKLAAKEFDPDVIHQRFSERLV